MKINILAKNYKVSEKLEENIEKKFEKLDKFFHEDVNANVVVSKFKDMTKLEATINAKQAVFRAEAIQDNVYDAMDVVMDKLSNQMSKLKGKLEERYKENKALKLEFIPEPEEDEIEEAVVVKRKQYELQPMVAEEAILQMEMLGHDFFVYLDMDTDSVNVVYKRKGNAYGLIETIR
ncbi:MAG: ribosome-associated translation inhibitor RaiA [Clostridiales bacterium]|nr:ribosome-associated translation inhibitor RaiA [Candidatus Crickella merdequi]